MEVIVHHRRDRGQPTQRWTWDVKDTLGKKMHEAGEQAKDLDLSSRL